MMLVERETCDNGSRLAWKASGVLKPLGVRVPPFPPNLRRLIWKALERQQ